MCEVVCGSHVVKFRNSAKKDFVLKKGSQINIKISQSVVLESFTSLSRVRSTNLKSLQAVGLYLHMCAYICVHTYVHVCEAMWVSLSRWN